MKLQVLLVVVASMIATPAIAAKKLALVVGVSEFSDTRWPALRFAGKDAVDMANALEPSFDQVIQAKSPVTRAAFWDAIAQLERNNLSDEDTIVIYVSSHGTLGHDNSGALARVLVTNDTRADQPFVSGVPIDLLIDRLDRLRSSKKLLILATCHAGAGKSRLPEQLSRELRGLKAPFFPEPPSDRSEGRIILAASAWGEVAREDDRLENDIYTYFFLEALKGFDLDRDGATTALEAHEYARRKTTELTGGLQRPTLTAEIVGRDPIVLVGERQRAGDPLIVGFDPAFNGARLEIDGREKGLLPGSFAIEPGARHIRVVRAGADEAMIDREIEAKSGSVVLVDQFLPGKQAESAPVVLSLGLGWRNIWGDSWENYLSHPSIGVGLEYPLGQSFRGGLSLVFGYATGPTLETRPFRTAVTNLIFGAIASAAWPFVQSDEFELGARLEIGLILGRIALEARDPIATQRIDTGASSMLSYGVAGAGLDATWWIVDSTGLRLSSTLGLLAGQPGRTPALTFSDSHRISAVIRL